MSEEFAQLCILNSQQEADLLSGLLRNERIEVIPRGAKEYAGLVTGVDSGRYEIMVRRDQLERAKQILASVPKKSSHPTTERSYQQEFKRAVIYALMALIILPVIFNWISLVAMKDYWKKSAAGPRRLFGVAVILLLNLLLGALAVVAFFYST